jgi:hypothetical protein
MQGGQGCLQRGGLLQERGRGNGRFDRRERQISDVILGVAIIRLHRISFEILAGSGEGQITDVIIGERQIP